MDINLLPEKDRRRDEEERQAASRHYFETPMTNPDSGDGKDIDSVLKETKVPNEAIPKKDVEPVAPSDIKIEIRPDQTKKDLLSPIVSLPKKVSRPNFLLNLSRSIISLFKRKKIIVSTTPPAPIVPPVVPKPFVPIKKQLSPIVKHEKRTIYKLFKAHEIWYLLIAWLIIVSILCGFVVGISLISYLKAPTQQTNINQSVVEGYEKKISILRDEVRLAQLQLIETALTNYWRENEARYPAGELIDIGGDGAFCLAITGWVARDKCIIPKSPFENRIYLESAPQDPGGGSYRYSAQNNGTDYIIDFVLEEGAGQFSAGTHQISSAHRVNF